MLSFSTLTNYKITIKLLDLLLNISAKRCKSSFLTDIYLYKLYLLFMHNNLELLNETVILARKNWVNLKSGRWARLLKIIDLENKSNIYSAYTKLILNNYNIK